MSPNRQSNPDQRRMRGYPKLRAATAFAVGGILAGGAGVAIEGGAGAVKAATQAITGGDRPAPTHLPQPGSPAAERGIANGTLEEIKIPPLAQGGTASEIAEGRQSEGDLIAGIEQEAEKYNKAVGNPSKQLQETYPLVVPVKDSEQ